MLLFRKSIHGFALVDVLVALAVAGLAGSILVGLIAYVERNASGMKRFMRTGEELVSVSRILRSLTEEAYSLRDSKGGVAFPHGTRLEFMIPTTGPQILSLSQPALFTLRSETLAGRTRMILQWIDAAGEHSEIVSDGLEHAEFSYFGRPDHSAERTWTHSWNAVSGGLEAVRLTVRLPGRSSPIELVAPLRGDWAVQCIRNPHQAGCLVAAE